MRDNINKSLLLKKYKSAYELCIKKAMRKSPKSKGRKEAQIKNCVDKVNSSFLKKSILKSRIKSSRSVHNKKVEFNIKNNSFITKSSPKKSLNSYQKFVKEQSKKPSIKKLSPTKRLKEISKLWKKQK
jgi:hypothetical protein